MGFMRDAAGRMDDVGDRLEVETLAEAHEALTELCRREPDWLVLFGGSR